ncbi:hypothetical protein GCM10010195_73350 [Kitasatospora griseola]|nr:hypothetical protein GCM10010195_73350 [Kitasatospora griseola]
MALRGECREVAVLGLGWVTGLIEEIREMAVSFSESPAKDRASVYSIITRRAA